MMNDTSNYNFSRYPFTPSQWQELEQQALIYKYMASGMPIPSDLLIPIKRSAPCFFNQPTMAWNCFQMGYGRKAEDPEPGRCRRTDGKKWRCSKEAYPNSKYCERHMHRGKNRSRKPVEMSSTTTTNMNATTTIAVNTMSNITSSSSSSYPLLYSHPYSSSSSSSSIDRDYSSWELRPLGLGEPRQQREEKEHCFVLGTDFKQEREVKERDFFDGWTQKSKGLSWMGFEGENNNSNNSTSHGPAASSSSSSAAAAAYSKTQLSISIPMDFPQW